MKSQHTDRIMLDPKIMVGKPVIKGTRITVEMIVRMVAQGIPNCDILEDYPRLTCKDIQAALHYAANIIAQDEVFFLPKTMAVEAA